MTTIPYALTRPAAPTVPELRAIGVAVAGMIAELAPEDVNFVLRYARATADKPEEDHTDDMLGRIAAALSGAVVGLAVGLLL